MMESWMADAKRQYALDGICPCCGQPKMIEKPISTENALISGDGPGEIADIVQDSKRQSDDSVQRKTAESASVPCPAQNIPEKGCFVPNQVRQTDDSVRTEPTDPVCACGGECRPQKSYTGFNDVYIVTWKCQKCGKSLLTHDGQVVHDNVYDAKESKSMPLCSSKSGKKQRTGDNPHIETATKPTMAGAFDEFFAEFGFVPVVPIVRVAESGSETPPNTGVGHD